MGEKVKLKQSTNKPLKGSGKGEQNLLFTPQPPLNGEMDMVACRYLLYILLTVISV